MTETLLNDLPPEHPMRNRPLLGMYHRTTGAKAWKEIRPSYGIAKSTFNDLNLDSWCLTEFKE